MGVKLPGILPVKTISFKELKGKKIAIDASNTLYQFLSSIRQKDGAPLMDKHGNITSHLVGLLTRSTNLMEKGLQLVYIFDGKMPELKYSEIISREQRKIEAEELYREAKDKEDINSMYKYSMRTTRLTQPMINEAKELIKALGMPLIQSIQEADAQISFMCRNGDVDYAASSDLDYLLHACPRLLLNLTLAQKRKLPGGKFVYIQPQLVELAEVLKHLRIDQDQLIVLGICSGTDYNPKGIKGIGPQKALKLVKETKNFDEIFKQHNADFDWKKIYNLFKEMPVTKDYDLKWTKPDADAVKSLLVDKHDFSEERVASILSKLEKENNKKKQSNLAAWT